MKKNKVTFINSHTQLYCLLGNPIMHSVSPQMQNTAFQSYNLNSIYIAFTIEEDSLENVVCGCKALGIKGFNVTIPYKKTIIKFIDIIDASANRIGAVNTVLSSNDRLIGFNTDGIGFVKAVGEGTLQDQQVAILGAGGAATAIVYEVASRASSITIFNRTLKKAETLVENVLNSLDVTHNISIQALPLNKKSLEDTLDKCRLLVNTTSIGMHPYSNKSPVPQQLLHSKMIVFDVVYNPLKTRLLKDAEMIGAPTISGLDMLLHQGGEAFKIWTGLSPPIEDMKKAALQALLGNETIN